MIHFCKGYTSIHNTSIVPYVYVEHDMYVTSSEIEEIANKSLNESCVFQNLFGIDKRYFKSIRVAPDDSYEGSLTEKYWTISGKWNYRKILALFPMEVEHNGKTYKTVVGVDREWFENEEQQN